MSCSRAFGLAAAALALAIAPAASAQPGQAPAQHPVLYVSQYKIQPARLDSLVALTREYEVPWHAAVAERVPGYQRWFYRHDTGDEYNYVVATMYPDWDMVRGDEIPYDEVWEAFKQTHGLTDADGDRVEALFEWAYEGSSHVDNVYSPITGEPTGGE